MSDSGDGDGSNRLTAEEMDEKRKEQIAYEYLCRLEEAKVWIEACIGEIISPTTELEESLQNGVVLAKLGHFISPEIIPLKKIYDCDLTRFKARGLHFRHTDNINYWLKSLKDIGLPENFYPETTDIYDRKNTPRLIYCIHALSMYMFKIGRAPQIQDLYGKIQFTNEEITNMRKELDKYGITMPSFSKIGGILAYEMPIDEAALHAAIIAINSAIDKGEASHTTVALMNPAAYLINVNEDLAEEYQNVLEEAKNIKTENCKNRSFDIEYVPDAYDELLTQAEIQGHINGVNIHYYMDMLDEHLERENVPALMSLLKRKELSIKNVKNDNGQAYLEELKIAKQRKKGVLGSEKLSKDDLQTTINVVNERVNNIMKLHEAMTALNKALDGNDPDVTLERLLNPAINISPVYPASKCLYHEELQSVKDGSYLEYPVVCKVMKILNAITNINNSIDASNSENLLEALLDGNAYVENVYSPDAKKYLEHFSEIKQSKQDEFCKLLTHHDIQSGVDFVNNKLESEQDCIEAVAKINELIDQDDYRPLFKLLPQAGIENTSEDVAVHYHQLLKLAKKSKALMTGDETPVLWFEEIQDTINAANQDLDEGRELSACVAAVNISVEDEELSNLSCCLKHPILCLKSVNVSFIENYLEALKDCRAQKCLQGSQGSGWMMNRLKNGSKFFFNVETMEGCWSKEGHVEKDFSLLTRDDIERCITEVNKASARHSLFLAHEDLIVAFQAQIKGMLARKRLLRKKEILASMSPAVKVIQRWWRDITKKKIAERRIKAIQENIHSIIKVQAFCRGYLVRKAYLDRIRFFKEHEPAIIRIQAFVRSSQAKQDYRALMHKENVSISVIRKFIHILEITDKDYAEEIELDKLKQQVVQDIRNNQKLDHYLTQMDIKIGLLVKNRISLQDVISQSKFLRQHNNNSSSSLSSTSAGPQPSGIWSLSKASRDKLEAYQHLFYLLQTQPNYLAQLMFELPQSKTTKFMETAVLSLFNYASSPRDEYMLIGLFKTALEEEIKSKVTSPSDIITGNPMVVKMIVSFNRNSRGQGLLRELLNPLVKSIIGDKKLQINTNVVEVYKQWINQVEAETGKPSHLPYEVSAEQALTHDEVSQILKKTVSVLQECTENFLSAILASIDKIPYGMRYMAKILRNALHERFPTCQEKEIMKIIGNLIYYRYINSAIVAPDAFDIIEVAASNGLSNEQRRNLGSIAKILQFAASNKGFSSDCPHLVPLNSYIAEAHSRFKKYFANICDVEEPELVFNIDKYSDVARITKPIIYISLGEIIDMHKLLLEHQHVIASDPKDPLHELLDDLGDACDIGSIIGDTNQDDVAKVQMLKSEISLTLSNKFEIPDNDHLNNESQLIRTKKMIIDILRCQKSGDSLMEILVLPSTEEEDCVHSALMKERERKDMRSTRSNLVRQVSSSIPPNLTLSGKKEAVISNLEALEKAGLVSKCDNYQSLVNAIVRDVRNQRLHRQRRKVEMTKLKSTLKSLIQKRTFSEEQVNYYTQYVKTCLDKQTTKTNRNRPSKSSVRYTGSRLHEKGILLDIDNLNENQFKNILFEICSTDDPGKFVVNAKFMGLNMEKVELKLQDLLELQYEGVSVMKMFNKARVNVNLLIYLLNHKFYGKK